MQGRFLSGFMMHSTLVICALALLFFHSNADSSNSLVEDGSKDNSDECDCYLASGPDPGYFQYHRFYDFRNVPNDGTNDYTIAPPLITSLEDQGGQVATCAFLNTTDFQTNWSIENEVARPNASVPAVNSAQNIYISRNSSANGDSSTYLTFRASRLPDFMSTSELTSNELNLLHSSIRARLRIIPNGMSEDTAPTTDPEPLDNNHGSNSSHPVDPGAVFGFFTYESDTEESDIEILTSDPINQIRYSNQPDYDASTDEGVEGASTDFTTPDGIVWTDWLEHRIDWFDGVSRWYINDELMLNKTINVPTSPSGLVLNLWGDGGVWSGNMSVGGQVTVAVEWIEMVFNISGNVNGPNDQNDRRSESIKRRDDKMCGVGCYVNGVQKVGFPEVAFNGTESGAFSIIRQGHRYHSGHLAAFTAGMFILFT